LFETGSKAQILQAGMGASSSSSSSSYRWTVVFDGGSTGGSLSGDLPLLVVVGEGISAAWTGGGLQVNVVEVVKGGREDVVGGTFNEKEETAAAPLVPLVFTAHGLTPYTKYRFRVRAVSTNGVSTNGGVSSFSSFSDWSPPSRPLGTKATVRPWLVRPPSSTNNVLLLTGNGRETVNTMDPSFSFGAGRGGKGLQPVSGKFYASSTPQ